MPLTSLLEQHLERLVDELELAPYAEKEGKFQLMLGTVSVSFKELDPGLLLFSQLGSVPEKKREELFILLMKANFLGQGTGGGVIGLDGEEKFLTLSLAIPYDVNYGAFKEAVEDFVNYADYWRKELAQHAEKSTL